MNGSRYLLLKASADRIPLLDGIAELARQEVLSGAVERNRESVDAAMLQMDGLSAAQQAILFSPETSGGLLVFLAPGPAEEYVRRLRGDIKIHGRVTAIRADKLRSEKLPGL